MSLIVKISADTSAFKRAVNTVSRDVQSFGGSISKMGDTFKPVSIAAAGIFTAAIKSGSEFEAKMSEVSAIGQIYGSDLEKLTEKAKQIGLETKFSASEAADGLKYMGQAGWDAQKSLDGIDAVMTLAAAGALDVGKASDILTDAITAMKYEAKDAGLFADVMAVAASKSNTSVEIMGETFKYSASVAGALGINIEDLSLAIGLMANSSIKGSMAGTSLRGGLTNLVKPTKTMADAMDKYGVSIKTNADGSVNLRETMVGLRKALKGLTETERTAALGAIFGKTAMNGWAAIVNATDDDFNNLAKSIDNSNGAAKKMQETMMNNTEGKLKIMLSSIEGAMISVFEAISPVVTDVANTITDLANKFGGLDKSTQKFIITGLAIGGLIAPVMKVAGAVTKLGGKIAAIPVALQKMQRGEVERQVNAWLKWNNVTDEQAAKLRKVARDIDTVKRGGAGAENAAKRLDIAMGKINVPPGVDTDLNKVGNSAKEAERKISNLNRELKGMKVKGIRGIKVDGSSVNVDVPSINKKIKGSGIGKSVGQTIGKDTADTLGSVLGSELGSTIGGKMGPIGALIGDIIGESAGIGLSKAVISGTSFAKVLSIIPKLFNPVTLGITVAAGGLVGLTHVLSNSKDDFSLWGEGVSVNGEKLEGFSVSSSEANEALKTLSSTWSNFDTEGNLKKLEVQVGIDYEEEAKSKLETIETTLQEHFNNKIEMIKNNNRLTEEEKEKYITTIKAQEEKAMAAQIQSVNRQMEFEKKFNEERGYLRYEAGKIMVLEELTRNELIEKALATSSEEKLAIEKRYADLREGALGTYISENFDLIKTGLDEELRAISDSGDDKLDELERQHKEAIKKIEETHGKDTESYKIAMNAQKLEYAKKKSAIIEGTREEIKIAQERLDIIKEDILKMKEQKKITVKEADEMLAALDKLAGLEYNPTVTINEYGVEELKDSLKDIEKWDGKVTQSTMALDKKPFDENAEAIRKQIEVMEGYEINPTAGINKTPWGEDFNGIKTDVENANKMEIRPTVFLNKGPYDITIQNLVEEMEGMTKNERIIYLGANIERFRGKEALIREALKILEETDTEVPLGMDKTAFEQGRDSVVEDSRVLNDETKPIVEIDANTAPFDGKNTTVNGLVDALGSRTPTPTIYLETHPFITKRNAINTDINNLDSKTPTPTVGLYTNPFEQRKGFIDRANKEMNRTVNTVTTTLDTSGAESGHWSLKGWLDRNPLVQRVKTIFTGGGSGGQKNAATGGQIGSGTTIVGERGPELVSRRGNSVTVQPLRATDRAMGGWSDKDLVGGKGGDVYNVTIVGANKSARELFDEIEQ